MPRNLYDQFVEDVCAGKTNETPIAYKRKLSVLQKWIGRRDPRRLKACDLRAFDTFLRARKDKLRGNKKVIGALSPWTIRSTLVTVKHFCKWMYRRKLIREDIAADFSVPQPPPPDPKPVTQKTIDALLEAAAGMGETWERVRNLAFLYCLRDTGGRLGSLLDASVNHTDLNAGEIETKSKGKVGTLYINAPTIFILRIWLDQRREMADGTDALFIGRYGRPLKRSGAYWILKRLARLAHCDGRFNPHAWRHAFVRDALKSRKVDLSQASRLLWHADIRVTADYYARWDDEELKQAHRRASPGLGLPFPKLPYGE